MSSLGMYPPINNHGVVQTGKSTFTLKHPDDTSDATVPMTIKVGTIFEIFEYHDAIQQLEKSTIKLQPELLAWDKFTKFWNTHALEDGPCFITWDAELGLYLLPRKVVSLTDLNLSRHIPKISSDLTKVLSNNIHTSRVLSHLSHLSVAPSVAATTPTNASAPASLISLLPADLQLGLATTGLARYVRIETSKMEYFKQRDQERKAKDAAKWNEKKTKKKLFWKGQAATQSSIPSSTEDVIMTGPVNDTPSSSKTLST